MSESEINGSGSEETMERIQVVRWLIEESTPGIEDSLKLACKGLYFMSRAVLGTVLHPVATFKATMLIGDKEEIERNVERSLSIPGIKGSGRLRL